MDKEGKKELINFNWKKKENLNFFNLVVRTDALKGRRGRLPSKPKSPSTRQPNSFQTQFCRFYNDSIPNPASHDFSKLNVNI
jgi:hypothetical protein